ncbi:MAG: YncE family protein, partial [candidate division WOR-3 bacterium]
DTLAVAVGDSPCAVAVNPVTNKVYVANYDGDNVTVIDGATNDTLSVQSGDCPSAVAVNPVLNRVYVTNRGDSSVTVIDGATNSMLTARAGDWPHAVAANPVTNKVYVANYGSDNVTVLTEVPYDDTEVRVEFYRLPNDTTSLAQPALSGKAVNRSVPNRTNMIGVVNRLNTCQQCWNVATITSGQGTDSITWSWNWCEDSLVRGENFLVAVPLEGQAGTTNSLGPGTPFAGNMEVYPVYRVEYYGAQQERTKSEGRRAFGPTIVRGRLLLSRTLDPSTPWTLFSITGRKVMDLRPGQNDIRHIAPGVYFVRGPETEDGGPYTPVRKVVIRR